jgi:hypothetical protein
MPPPFVLISAPGSPRIVEPLFRKEGKELTTFTLLPMMLEKLEQDDSG